MPMLDHYLTAGETATLYGWSLGYVRKLAHRDNWRRTGRAPTRYMARDVHDTHSQVRRKPLTST